ncbi:hypothetical protein HanPI659440_Chr17g0674791 [Helianthus annuus]|nr:hypothetical protein HanPI659440_Chr17g0674791 [Helianthus annuus]
MIFGLIGMHFGGKTSWVFSFHADPVLSNPNPCIRTLYNYLLSQETLPVTCFQSILLSSPLSIAKILL